MADTKIKIDNTKIKKKPSPHNQPPKGGNKAFSFEFNNTITLTVMFAIMMTVGVVLLITYAYTLDSTKRFQKEISGDFISTLKVFNHDIETNNFSQIQPDLNNVFSKDYNVEYVLVLDANMKEIYSSHSNSQYVFMNPENARSLKLTEVGDMNLKNLSLIHIPKQIYNVYIGINKPIVPDNPNFNFDTLKIFMGLVLLSILIISYMLAQSIAKPLSDMRKTISKISEGDLSGRLKYTKFYEINQLVESYNFMVNTIQKLYSTLEKQVQDRTVELKNAYSELQNTQAIMVHNEKMKSLGELVAGIMHEINNPINFIYGNMTHLDNYSKDLVEIIETYTKFDDNLKEENLKEIKELKSNIDYDFLKSDMPDLIRSCKEGADRAKNIIQDLKSFSRMEEIAVTDVNIPHEIDTVLNILHNKIKHKAEVHKEYDENVPKIEALGGQLNQVFMNILDNAVGAIEEKGDIWIRIHHNTSNDTLNIEIEDNGIGMDEETQRKVFNPFFTTKPVGQGTGLGMSISYKIIKNHQGDIKVESKKGSGSKFIITLPLKIDMEKLNSAIGSN